MSGELQLHYARPPGTPGEVPGAWRQQEEFWRQFIRDLNQRLGEGGSQEAGGKSQECVLARVMGVTGAGPATWQYALAAVIGGETWEGVAVGPVWRTPYPFAVGDLVVVWRGGGDLLPLIVTAKLRAEATIVLDDTLSYGTVGAAYTGAVAATGGTGPYTYAVTSGALPAGLTLASDGAISGTPTTAGTSAFTVTATDANDATGSREYSVMVTSPTSPRRLLNITRGEIPEGEWRAWLTEQYGLTDFGPKVIASIDLQNAAPGYSWIAEGGNAAWFQDGLWSVLVREPTSKNDLVWGLSWGSAGFAGDLRGGTGTHFVTDGGSFWVPDGIVPLTVTIREVVE